MNQERLAEYARLIVKMGLNPEPGQQVMILAGLDQPEFARMVVEECYRQGASKVIMDWRDMATSKLDQLYQSEETLGAIEEWELKRLQWRVDNLPAFLWLDSDDPDGMNGIDQGKRARAQQMRFPKIQPYRDAMESRYQWCIVGVPGVQWARKVFPQLDDASAVEKLWDAILTASRVDGGDAVANWQQHNEIIHQKCQALNELGLSRLHYRSSNGTDFTVGLMPQSRFAGAAEKDLSGRTFNPNIPSEEVFTTPQKGQAEGVVVATKPLSWQGSLIDQFSVHFKDGKVCRVEAKEGQEALERMVTMDEGAAYLGECALIPYDSPINNTGVLFYNTLFDENASCHLALGRGYAECVKEFQNYTKDQLGEMGVNDSMIHVDFMIGAPDLDITGTTADGKEIPIFRKGDWAL